MTVWYVRIVERYTVMNFKIYIPPSFGDLNKRSYDLAQRSYKIKYPIYLTNDFYINDIDQMYKLFYGSIFIPGRNKGFRPFRKMK